MLNFSRSVDLSRTCCVVNEPGSAKCPTMYKEYRRVMPLLEMEVIEQAASLSSFVPGGCKTSTSMFNNDSPQLSRCQTRCTPIPLGCGLKRIASSIMIIHYQYLPVTFYRCSSLRAATPCHHACGLLPKYSDDHHRDQHSHRCWSHAPSASNRKPSQKIGHGMCSDPENGGRASTEITSTCRAS